MTQDNIVKNDSWINFHRLKCIVTETDEGVTEKAGFYYSRPTFNYNRRVSNPVV